MNNTLIFGSGDCARQVAGHLTAQGYAVAMVGADGRSDALAPSADATKPITLWEGARLIDCRGQAGAFQLTFDHGGRRIAHQVGCIVVAEQENRSPNFEAYGLQASDRVLPISAAETAMAREGFPATAQRPVQVLFLNAWTQDCHPVTAARMLQLCLAVQQRPNMRTFYMAGNLKVSGNGMEACCQAAKAAGTMFFKFGQEVPKFAILENGRIQVEYWDATTRMTLRLAADYVVVDEKIAPHSTLENLAQVLRIDRDAAGFVQSDNIHRFSNATNRRGIFVAGGGRTILSNLEQQADAEHVALKVVEFLADLDREVLPRVEIDQGRCARCLTCFRLCPYGAIESAPRMTIVPQACQSCGLCAAGCPNRAIQVDDRDLEAALTRLITPDAIIVPNEPFVPRLVAFCCRRSAVQAREMAITMGHRLPSGMVFVEGVCGGTFSVRHLLSALEAGADGVMVLTCHEGNCHSESGALNARKRVITTTQALAQADIAADRIQFSTLAANMGAEFARRVDLFAQTIAAMGPTMENSKGRHVQ
ncbi:MAG: hydrogenase iron-sulfur subunit [Desulfatitalea sp.]